MVRKSQIVTKSHNCDFLSQFGISDFRPMSMPPQKPSIPLLYKKTVPIISGNLMMKSRFACADAFPVRKHTGTFFPTGRFVYVTFFSGKNL